MSASAILCVTTDAGFGTRLCARLQHEGARAQLVPDAAGAIRCLVERPPAILILDALYDALDPVRIARRARICNGREAPVIVVLAPGGVAADPWLASLADVILNRDADAPGLAHEVAALVLAA